MILLFEMTNSGSGHAPGNSHLVQIMARAAPNQVIRVHADATHCHELRQDQHLAALANVEFHPVGLPSEARGAVNVFSPRRFLHELRTIRAALARAPAGEPCLILLASSTGTEIRAARLAGRLSGRRFGVQVALHGYLNSAFAWRSRNPLLRALDFRAMLAKPTRGLRFLLFEDSIRRELVRLVPETESVTDVLPLAVNTSELGAFRARRLDLPLDIGLVGGATEAKGITPFLETARMFRARHGTMLRFHIVGGRLPGSDPGRFADIAHDVTLGHLPRQVFLDRLAALHYVFLPMQPGYYNLSPSGALLDAVTWLKPVIATRLPIVADMFAEAGDIGELCDDVPAMQAALDRLVRQPDAARYDRQVAALGTIRDARTPAALAPRYRDILARGWPGLLPAQAAHAA
jgi:hypothetical protein